MGAASRHEAHEAHEAQVVHVHSTDATSTAISKAAEMFIMTQVSSVLPTEAACAATYLTVKNGFTVRVQSAKPVGVTGAAVNQAVKRRVKV